MGESEITQIVMLLKHHSIISINSIASFFHIIMLVFNTLSPMGHMPVHSQCFGWLTSHACTFSFTCWLHGQRHPLKIIFGWTKHIIIQTDQIRTTRRMLQHLKIQIPEGVKSVDGKCVAMHCHATLQHPLSPFLGILFKYLVSTSPTASHYNWYCLLLCLCLDSVPEWESIRSVNITFPADGWVLSFFLIGHVTGCHSIVWHLLSSS